MPGDADQNFGITYNGYAVGAATGRSIHGYKSWEDGYAIARVTFNFVLGGYATELELNTAGLAAEAAFRTPRADLLVTNGGSTRKSFSHSGATGFDADPKIRKVGDPKFDSSWSQLFAVDIAFGLPADNVGTSGRRTSTVTVAYEPSRRRTITIEGEYTQIPGGSANARAQYEGAIETYRASVLSFLGVTNWDLMEEPVTTQNATNKTLAFRQVIRELRHSEFGAASDAEVIGLEMDIYLMEEAPGDTPPATRLVTIGVDFSCWLDFDESDDLQGKWEQVLPILIQEAQDHFNRGPVGLVHSEPHFEPMSNRLSGHLKLQGIASSVLESRVTTRDYIVHGNALDPAWGGDDRMKYLFKAPRQIQRTITRTKLIAKQGGGGASGDGNGMRGGFSVGFGQGFGGGAFFNGQGAGQGGIVIGGGAGAGAGAAAGGAAAGSDVPPDPDEAQGCSVVLITSERSQTPLRRGLSGYSFDVTETLQIDVYEYFIPVTIAQGNTQTGTTGQAG